MVFIFACERLTFHGRPRSLHGHVLWTWGCFMPERLDVSNCGPSFAKLAGFICQQIMFKTIMITFSLSPNEFRKAHGFISQLKAPHLLYEHQSFVVWNASIPAFLLRVQPYSSSAVWPFENSLWSCSCEPAVARGVRAVPPQCVPSTFHNASPPSF